MSKLSHSSEEFMDKIERNSDKYFDVDHCQCDACIGGDIHASDCAVHNMPAYPNGSCDCALCRTGETRAVMAGLPSSDEICGRHVHKGRMFAKRDCCNE